MSTGAEKKKIWKLQLLNVTQSKSLSYFTERENNTEAMGN